MAVLEQIKGILSSDLLHHLRSDGKCRKVSKLDSLNMANRLNSESWTHAFRDQKC